MTDIALTRRGLIAAAVAATAAPSLAFGQAGTPRPGGVLKISHSTRIATLNVLQLSGPAEYPSVDMIYSGLTRVGIDMRPMPDLATEWSADDEAKTSPSSCGRT
jgi:peptide/nickel transport system substrate-binding protein